MSPKILVADDEPNIVISLEYLLKREGYTVVIARDGQEAVDAIVREQPDLVLLDIQLPGEDGFQLLQKLQDTGEALPPVLALTAHAMAGDRTASQASRGCAAVAMRSC